jgi:hypothetical protein
MLPHRTFATVAALSGWLPPDNRRPYPNARLASPLSKERLLLMSGCKDT